MNNSNDFHSGPLNRAQQRLWYLYQTAAEHLPFNLVITFHFRGSLKRARLERAINALLIRHPALRSRIAAIGAGEQTAFAPQPIELTEHDISDSSATEQEKTIEQYLHNEQRTSFDLTLSTAPRWRLFKRAADNFQLMMTVHHIVFDNVSLLLTARSLSILYNCNDSDGDANLPAENTGIIDHALWEQSEQALQSWQNMLPGWQAQLQTFPDHLCLPEINPGNTKTASHKCTPGTATLTRIQTWSRKQHMPLFMVLKAVFELLLFHHCRQSRFLIGTDIGARALAQLANTIGFFINQLPLLCEVDTSQRLSQWLKQSVHNTRYSLKHRHIPFDRLVSSQAIQRHQSISPLFQVKMNYQKRFLHNLRFGDAVLTSNEVYQHIGPFYLTLDLVHCNNTLSVNFEYQQRFFSAQKIALIAHQWLRLLEHFPDLIMSATLSDIDAQLAQWARDMQSAQQLTHQRPQPILKRCRTR